MKRLMIAATIATVVFGGNVMASSHREAPLISGTPKVDATDFYMFRSYEAGRVGFVTMIANYQPLQDAYGGPNYFPMDDKSLYAINVDNNGDGLEDLSFFFVFRNQYKGITVPVNGMQVAIPLSNIGPFGDNAGQDVNRNLDESYALVVVRDRANATLAKNLTAGGELFPKPSDNIGNKSIPNYDAYANRHISRVAIPGCAAEARVFVGQRNDSFSVNLGEIFDLINTNPVGPTDGERNIIANKNVTSIALEMPIQCLRKGTEPVIGAWTTAYVPSGDSFKQASRLSAPLVNEIVIGLPDKDRFNASEPRFDAQFAKYVTNPTLPILVNALFPSVTPPNQYPRTDLVQAFLTGFPGFNKPLNVVPAEMLRLNTLIEPKTAANQDTMGVLAGDNAGFPNGRRPGDDVVDIELRVAMGALLPLANAPSGQLPYTDGAPVKATDFRSTFPYLNTPVPGAVND